MRQGQGESEPCRYSSRALILSIWYLWSYISDIYQQIVSSNRYGEINFRWKNLAGGGGCPFLTRWGQVTHISVGNLSIIGSDNGLSPGRRQATIRTNAGMYLIWLPGTIFGGIWFKIHIFSFKKMHLKMSSAKWRLFCPGLNILPAFS